MSDDLRPLLSALGWVPGERATLLQLSSAFCAPCRATRRVLAHVAARVPGVAHVELDAEQHLDVVRRLAVESTPTTLVLDADGHEVRRATGRPTPAQVRQALPFPVCSRCWSSDVRWTSAASPAACVCAPEPAPLAPRAAPVGPARRPPAAAPGPGTPAGTAPPPTVPHLTSPVHLTREHLHEPR